MEAVAALGIAGNVVQFIDFATKLCVTSGEIYRHTNGASAANTQAEMLLESFIETIDEVSLDLESYFSSLKAASGQAQQQDDAQVTDIINDCQIIASDLLQRFNKLKTNGKKDRWKSFVAGVKCIWRKNELEELSTRLKKNREELQWRITLSLRNGMNLVASRQEDQLRNVQSAITTILTDVLYDRLPEFPRWPETIESTLQQLRNDVVAVAASKYPDSQQERSILSATHAACAASSEDGAHYFVNSYAAHCAAKLVEDDKVIWQSLSFRVMDDREDQIAPAEMKTFEWILQCAQDTQRPWSNFIDWLESGSSMYWISGKAGSGKSTMMKFLNSHCTVLHALRTWSENIGIPLVKASFYFWHNGNTLQKTQEGLLRSLLYQALKGHRELIPIVLEGALGVRPKHLGTYWTLPRLKAAFHRLVTQQEVPLNVCFFIDGLDEYAGNLSEIVEVFQNAAKSEHVKICVSSRPLLIFDRAFKDAPGLVLQNLTFEDIQMYVKMRFHNDERFQELEVEEPGLGPYIARQVVSKASGVFLWVKLVVHSLLEGIQNYDRGSDLERRLNELPEDLTDLYWHMLNRVKPVWYLEEGFKLLLMVRSAHEPLTLLRLAFADLNNANANHHSSDFSVKEQNALCRSMAGRIKSRCLGLLEIIDNTTILPRNTDTTVPDITTINDWKKVRVQFLHKSVADFIDTPEMLERVRVCFESSATTFLPELAIMRAIFNELATVRSRFSENELRGNYDKGENSPREFSVEIARLNGEADEYADIIKESHPAYINEQHAITTEINEIVSKLWNLYRFPKVKGIYSNMASYGFPRIPYKCPDLHLLRTSSYERLDCFGYIHPVSFLVQDERQEGQTDQTLDKLLSSYGIV